MAKYGVLVGSVVLALLMLGQGAKATVFTVKNNCNSGLWIDISSGVGGFWLERGQQRDVGMPNGQWSGRVKTTSCAINSNSLAEFTLHNAGDGLDWYNLSNVDGFDYPLSITPTNGGCQKLRCNANVRACPGVTGCTCVNPNRDYGETSYAQFIRAQCPQTYSWSKDDRNHVFTCRNSNYLIQFCSSGVSQSIPEPDFTHSEFSIV